LEFSPTVPDLFLIEAGTATFILIIILALMMSHTVRAGQLGLVFLFCAYVTTLQPGFSVTSPLAGVRKIIPGSGPNAVLGMIGVAESDLGPDVPLGTVRVGERAIPARGASSIPSGATVRVIEDSIPGTVLVAIERPRFGPAVRRGPYSPGES
jgi:membrane-bound ClpP family serine protease